MLSVAINDSLAARKTEALIPWRFPASSGFEPEAAQAASSSLAEAGSLDLQPVSRPTRLPNGASLPAGSASMGRTSVLLPCVHADHTSSAPVWRR